MIPDVFSSPFKSLIKSMNNSVDNLDHCIVPMLHLK